MSKQDLESMMSCYNSLPVFLISDDKKNLRHVSGVFSTHTALRNIISSLSLFFLKTQARGQENTYAITSKEQLVLSHLSKGLSDKMIATQSGLSLPSVKYYLRRLYQKLEVQNRYQAIVKVQDIDL